MLNIKTFVFNPFAENTYLLWDDTLQGAIVDPGNFSPKDDGTLLDYVDKQKILIKFIVLTHGHFDHIFGARSLSDKLGVPIYMHPLDKPVLENNRNMVGKHGLPAPDLGFETKDVQEGDTLSFGETTFKVIHTPGHSPGGICLLDEKDQVLLCGDTLFAGSIGRSDLFMGDYDKLIVSIMDKLMGLPSDTEVLPGHGYHTNIGYERTHNPFLQPFNEKDEEADWNEDGLEISGDIL